MLALGEEACDGFFFHLIRNECEIIKGELMSVDTSWIGVSYARPKAMQTQSFNGSRPSGSQRARPSGTFAEGSVS